MAKPKPIMKPVKPKVSGKGASTRMPQGATGAKNTIKTRKGK